MLSFSTDTLESHLHFSNFLQNFSCIVKSFVNLFQCFSTQTILYHKIYYQRLILEKNAK